MEKIGQHDCVEVCVGRDVNGRYMVICRTCHICAHARYQEEAKRDLSMVRCSPNCLNCTALRHSYPEKIATPLGGSRDDVLHVCPGDGIRWWQSNSHFHIWQTVTSDKEWELLNMDFGGEA